MKLNTTLIEKILEIFEITTGLEIISLTLNGSTIKSKINTNFYNESFNSNEIYNLIKDIKNYQITKEIKYISIAPNKELASIFIDNSKRITNYFIIGPYKTAILTHNKNSIPYKPRYSINYIINLLVDIIEDNEMPSKTGNSNFLNINIRNAIQYIYEFYEEPLTIETVSRKLNLHKCYFCNTFKEETGMTFTNFLNKFRVEKSKKYLNNVSLSILDVAISVGFNNQSYYTMAFKKFMNMTPMQYRKQLNILICKKKF